MLKHLAALATRHPWRVVGGAALVLAVAVAFGAPVTGLLSGASSNFEDAGSESVAARRALEAATGASPDIALVALVEPGGNVRSGPGRARVEAVAQRISADPIVARAVTYFETGDPALVARDGRSTYVAASFKPASDRATEQAVDRLRGEFGSNEGVTLGGLLVGEDQVEEQVSGDLARAELAAFPILFLVSLFVFRGLVAAFLPLLVGLISILVAFLLLRLTNELTPLSVFALNLITGLGLGLAIDYSLFVVSRFREELARAGQPAAALARTLATAGRTVAYSALTVAAALSALLLFPLPFLYSMGIGGIFVVLSSAVTALVVLPAILVLLGHRVDALAPSRRRRATVRSAGERSGFWYRLATAVMRRPGPIAAATAALLIALGLPFLRVEFTSVDPTALPQTASARQVFDSIATDFPPSRAAPIYLAVEAPDSARGAVEDYAASLRDLPGVAAVEPPQPVAADLWRIDVISAEKALAESTQDVVRAVRSAQARFDVAVGGESAAFVDQRASIASRMPAALAMLAAGTFLLLFAMTGSVVIPAKALVMNLLTASATFGALVLIFQDGRLEGVLGFDSQGALELTQPILIFVLAFGLSTDYAIFLLTRIREALHSGLSNAEAVATGLARSGPIVTAAALLFAIAIGAFSTSELVFIKLIGVGAALAVLIDASVVRALLVPSLMKLLGDWNWWAPRPLRRLHERLHLGEWS